MWEDGEINQTFLAIISTNSLKCELIEKKNREKLSSSHAQIKYTYFH